MKAVIVLPSIVPEMTEACLATLSPALVLPGDLPRPPTRQYDVGTHIVNGTQWHDGAPLLRLVIVWNSPKHNLGVAGSWNVGIDDMVYTGADWLVLLSAAVRFGPAGGTDFLRFLDEYQQARPDVLGIEAGGGLGWHCLAIPRHVIEKVGRFDPIYHPAYFEDNDWSVRVQRAYDRDAKAPGFRGPLWPKVEIDATLTEIAHGIKRSGVQVDMGGLKAKFVAKWGPDESFRTPYDDPSLDWTHTGGPLVAA